MDLFYYIISSTFVMAIAFFLSKKLIKVALHINSGAPLGSFEKRGAIFLGSYRGKILFLILSILLLGLTYFIYPSVLNFTLVSVISVVLLACLFMDVSFKLLPDVYTIPLMFLGIATSCLNIFSLNITQSLIGGAIMFLIFFIVERVGEIFTDKMFLGGGDIKLLMAFGFMFGVVNSIIILFLSSFVMLFFTLVLWLIKKLDDKELPFGVGLTTVAMINIFHPQLIEFIIQNLTV